jgi:phosphatidate cytidylyltransferase
MSKGNLIGRLAVAAVGIPMALVVLVYGGWLLTLFVCTLAVMATWEMNALASARGVKTFRWLGLLGTAVLVLLAGWNREFSLWAPRAVAVLLLLFFAASAAAVKLRTPEDRPLMAASVTLVGAFYWGCCFSFAIFLRHLPESWPWPDPDLANRGPLLLAFPLAVTWTADTAAWLFGSLFGRKKMIPSVSPGKTVEGGIAGLSLATLVGALMGWLFLNMHPEPAVAALIGGGMGLMMGVIVQLGDLIESLFKREAGVKDSGSVLPGHGGILDRFDALIFTLPFTHGLIYLVGRLL